MDMSLQVSEKKIEEYLAVLEGNPEDREAFEGLQNLYTTLERWDALLKLYDREARRASEGPARAELYFQIGKLWGERIGNKQQAMRHYQLAFRADPKCTKALVAARRIYRDLGNWKMVARLLELQLEPEEQPQARADLLASLGQVLQNELGDAKGATGCFERALSLVPDHPVAGNALDTLRASRDTWRDDVEGMRHEAESTRDAAQRAALFVRIAELFHREDRGAPEAENYVRQALQAESGSRAAAELLAQVLEEQGRFEELSQHLREMAERTSDPADRAQLFLKLARIAQNNFSDVDAALGYYQQVLSIEPQNVEALPAVLQGLRKRHAHAELFALGDRTLESNPPQELKVRLLCELGEVAWREQGDRQRAERYLKELRRLAPGEPLCLEFFRQDLGETQDWKVQYDQLARAVRAENDASRRREIYRTMARIAEERLSSPKDAVDVWRSLLEIDRTDAEARERLKGLYRRLERWHALVELLKTEIELLPPERVEEKIALYEEMVEIYGTRLQMEPMVINTLNAVLHVSPRHRPTLDRLSGIYERRESWGQLADILGRKADATEDPREKLELLHRSAEIWLSRLQSPDDAVKRYEDILNLDPTDVRALQALRKVYEQRRAYEPLVQVYLREIDILPDPDAKVKRSREVAEWAQKHLHRPARLIELWNKVLEFDDRDVKALTALSSLYEREERWQALAEVLQRLIKETEDTRARVQLMKRLGQIWSERLSRDDLAVSLWEEALALDPNNAEVFKILRDRYVRNRDFAPLEQLYARRGRWEEYIDVLVVQAESSPEPAQKCQIYFQIADVWEVRLGRKDRAARIYERVLEIDPQSVRAAQALLPLYEKNSEWRKLVQVEEILAGAASDPHERAARLRKISQIQEERLRRADLAFGYASRAFVEDPAAEGAIAHIERLAEAHGGWQELAAAYESARQSSTDAALRRDLSLRAASLYDQKLGKTDAAIAAYESLRVDEPLHPGALAALGRLYRQTERWSALLELLRAQVADLSEESEKRTLLFEIAELEERLGRTEAAIAVYQSILSIEDDEPQALASLARLYETAEKFEPLADTLARLLRKANPLEHVPLLEKLGRVLMGPLGDSAAAVERFRQLLDLVPDHPGALGALEELMEGSPSRALAARLLVDRYTSQGAWARSLRPYEALVKEATEGGDRVGLLLEIGRICEQELKRPEQSFAAYARAFHEDPGDTRTFVEAERVAGLLDRDEELAGLIIREADRIDNQTYRAQLTLRAAILYSEFEKTEKAVAAYGAALDLGLPDEDARRALANLSRLYEQAEEWKLLLATLRRALELADESAARKEILQRMGGLMEEHFQDTAGAVQAYRDVLALDPDYEPALRRLDQLYDASKDWSRLADVLSALLRVARSPGEATTLRCRLGHLLADKLDRAHEAIEEFRTALELDPECDEAVTAIEAIVARVPDLRIPAAEILAPVYERRGDLEKVAAALQALLPTRPPEERVEILHRVAGMADEAGNSERAFDAYLHALRESPASRETRARLGRLADRLARWPQLLEVLESELGNITDSEEAVVALCEMAATAEDRLEDFERAVRYFEQALEHEPDNAIATAGLERLYPRIERWRELARLLSRQLEHETNAIHARELAMRIGALYDQQLGDLDHAIEAYQKVQVLFSEDSELIDILERLYLRTHRFEDLVGIYLKRIEFLEAPQERKELLWTVAELLEKEIRDPRRAVQTYRRVADLDPDDVGALQALARLYEQLSESEELLGVLTQLIDVVTDPSERIRLRHRMGQLWQGPLGSAAHAVVIYRDILAEDPEHAPTIAALEELVTGSSERVLAAQVLGPLYAERGQWEKYVAVTKIELQESEDPREKVSLLHRIAAVYESRLGERGEAFACYRQALRFLPHDENTTREIERLAAMDQRFVELTQVYEETLQDIAEPALAKRLALKVARIFDDVLSDTEKAVEKYRRVLVYDPEERTALSALERLYFQAQRWPELAETLARELELSEEPSEVVEFHHRLGALLDTELEDPSGAIRSFSSALALDENYAPTIAALESMVSRGREVQAACSLLEPVYRRQMEWAKLTGLLETEAAALEKPAERKRLLREISHIQEERLQSWDLAFASLARALREDPADRTTVVDLLRLADQSGAWEELAGILEDEQERISDDVTREALALQVASIYETHLRQAGEAVSRYRAIVQRNPRCVRALEALDQLYSDAAAWKSLSEVLRWEAEAARSPAEELAFLGRLAALQEDHLEDISSALETYRDILQRSADHMGALTALERIYRMRDEPGELYKIYERRLSLAPDENARAGILAAMADLASERLNRPEDAIDLWQQALREVGEDDHLLAALERLFERTNRHDELCDVLARRARIAREPAQVAHFYSRRGRVYAEVLGRDEEAVESWRAVLQVRPDDLVALGALRELYRRGRRFGELAEVLQTAVNVATREGLPAEHLVALTSELGDVLGDVLMRPAAAIDAWTSVLELDPTNRRGLEALERLYSGEEAWAEAVDVLERRVALAEGDEEKAEALYRAADVYDKRMQAVEKASALYHQILEMRPADTRAAEALEALYERTGNFEPLAELLLGRMESIEASWERLTLLRRIADVYLEKLDRPDMAFIVLCRAVREDPRDSGLLDEVERLARTTGNFEELALVFEDMATGATDRDLLVSLHGTLARYYADELRHPDYAVAHYRRILSLDAENKSALNALEQLLRRESRLPELCEILRRKADLAVELPEKKQYLFDIAEISEKALHDLGRAAAALEDVVRLDEHDEAALGLLRRIYEHEGRWRELIDVLRRIIALTEDVPTALELREQIAQVLDRELNDAERAADVHREVLSLDPERAGAREHLERILTVQRRWDELVDLLSQQISFTHSPIEEITLHEKIAALWEEQLGNSQRAIESYRAILRIEPKHQEALEALERLHEATENWPELADVLERRSAAARSEADSVRLLRRLGSVYEKRLSDFGQAAGAYQRALDLAPDDAETLAALGGIYEAVGEYKRCVELLERAAQLSGDRRKIADMWNRVAVLSMQKLSDFGRAEQALRASLSADPTHLPAISSLKDLYISRNDWKHALEILEREEEQTFDRNRKAELLCEMGRLALTELEDRVGAEHYYEMAIEKVPGYLPAARPLADLYFDRGEPQKARSLLEMVVKYATETGLEGRELALYRHRLAVVTEKGGDEAAALEFYQAAYEADLTYLPTLLALGDLLYRREDWDRAFKVYQSLIVHHSESKDVDLVEVYYRLGIIRQKLGERRKAIHSFDKALELNPAHLPTLKALAEANEAAGEWEEVVNVRRRLIGALPAIGEKVDTAVSVADICREKLKNPQRAIQTLIDALDIDPKNLIVLHKLLELYTETRQWRKAIEVLDQIAAVETDSEKLATYTYSVAVIYRDELKELDPAIEYFNKTLDANPMRLKAFEAIDKVLTQRRDWTALAQNYRIMLDRFGENGPRELRMMLWKNLGEIYRTRMRNFEEAVPCYKVASALAPGDLTLHIILSELFEDNKRNLPGAVQEHGFILAADPRRFASYHSLHRIYREAKEHDRAFRICHTLKYLGQIEPHEEQYMERVRQAAPKRPQRPLDERLWQVLLHPTEDRLLGAIFAFLSSAMLPIYLVQPKDLGVKKKDRIETTDLQIFFSRIFQLARGVLGVTAPEVFLKPEGGHLGLTLTNSNPVTLLVGPDMVQDRPEPELAFALAKQLTYLRPEHLLSALLPPLVESIFYAGVRSCFPTQKLPEHIDRRAVDELAKRIEKALAPAALAQLRTMLQQFYQGGRHFQADTWLASIEHSGNRAGYVVCSDLVAADRVLQQERVAISKLSRADKVSDLLLFSISEEYFTLRNGLGMSVHLP
jgi:tetratricopeptide (TPR) repeat protein